MCFILETIQQCEWNISNETYLHKSNAFHLALKYYNALQIKIAAQSKLSWRVSIDLYRKYCSERETNQQVGV